MSHDNDKPILATVSFLKVSMIGLRGVTSDIKNHIMNPVLDHQVVPGKNSGTEEPTGANTLASHCRIQSNDPLIVRKYRKHCGRGTQHLVTHGHQCCGTLEGKFLFG